MNQSEMLEKFLPEIKEKGKDYSKKAIVLVRKAVVGEKVETHTKDGKETTNTATEDNFIVRNPTGEEYLLKGDLFRSRSHLPYGVRDGEWESYKANGSCRAIVWEYDQMEFIASWGQPMVIKRGDMLASPLPQMDEIYRIALDEFQQTYS